MAGRGKALAAWQRVQPILTRWFPEPEIHFTTGPGEAERRAEAWTCAHPASAILVVGGDGTMHEAINGATAAGHQGAFGLIPGGTGNDMARNLGMPLDPLSAAQALDPARPRGIDLGCCRFRGPDGRERSRWFLNSVSVGISARANRIAPRLGPEFLGASRYPIAGVLALITGRPAGYDIASGNRTLYSGKALNLTIANGAGFGGGLRISPGSKPDDGMLDLVVIGPIGWVRALSALARLRSGSHLATRGVEVHPGLRSPIRIRPHDELTPAETDGENLLIRGELVVELASRRLGLF